MREKVDIYKDAPTTIIGKHMEVLRQVDWEAHRRDNCEAAHWAYRYITHLETELLKIAAWKGVYPIKDCRSTLGTLVNVASAAFEFESNNEPV